MKKKRFFPAALLALLVIGGLWYASRSRADVPETPSTEETTLETQGTVTAGWQEEGGVRRYILADGSPATGWQEIDGVRCYLTEDGSPISGWAEVDGKHCYFNTDGTPAVGWTTINEDRYYLDSNGVPAAGWTEIDGSQYYFLEDGALYTGWLELEGSSYYFHEDGTMAVGPTVIGSETYYFSPHGVNIVLVNPWTYMPEDYAANLLPVENEQFVEVACYQSLLQMLEDCEVAGYSPLICSGYRSQATQERLYNNKTNYYLDLGYGTEEAMQLAGTVVAVPGTSEHQLGLAVDLVDTKYNLLDEGQAETGTQKWLMEHCWEYGFILRYPVGSTEITGIIYEPWHYRYVGVEIAMEIRDLDITLEEYLGFTHE